MKYTLGNDENQLFKCRGMYYHKGKMKADGITWYLTDKRLVLAELPLWLAILGVPAMFLSGTEIKRVIQLDKISGVGKVKKGLGQVLEITTTDGETHQVAFSKEKEMIELIEKRIS